MTFSLPAQATPFAYVVNNYSQSVSVLDTATNTIVASIPVGLGPVGVAVTPYGTRAYMASDTPGQVVVIDTATNTVVTIVNTAALRSIALTPDGTRAFLGGVGTGDSAVVQLLETSTNQILGTVQLGASVHRGIVITPTGALAYVANSRQDSTLDTLSVFDTSTFTLVATLQAERIPYGIAITTKTGPPPASPWVSPPTGLVSWWAGDSDATDLQGNNSGVLHGAQAGVPGRVAGAFALDGTNDYVEIPTSSSLTLTNAVTLAGWVSWAGGKAPGTNSYLLDKQTAYALLVTSDGHMQVFLNYPAVVVTTEAVLPLHEWHHLAATYDRFAGSNNVKVYIDGQLAAVGSATVTLQTDSAPVRIGCYSNNGGTCSSAWGFPGQLDEVAVYSRALEATEVAALVQAADHGWCEPIP